MDSTSSCGVYSSGAINPTAAFSLEGAPEVQYPSSLASNTVFALGLWLACSTESQSSVFLLGVSVRKEPGEPIAAVH